MQCRKNRTSVVTVTICDTETDTLYFCRYYTVDNLIHHLQWNDRHFHAIDAKMKTAFFLQMSAKSRNRARLLVANKSIQIAYHAAAAGRAVGFEKQTLRQITEVPTFSRRKMAYLLSGRFSRVVRSFHRYCLHNRKVQCHKIQSSECRPVQLQCGWCIPPNNS